MKKKIIQRNKAWLGAVISGIGNIAGSLINNYQQKKQQEELLKQQKAEEERQRVQGLNTAAVQQAGAMTNALANQNYVDEYNKKVMLKNGGLLAHNKLAKPLSFKDNRVGSRGNTSSLYGVANVVYQQLAPNVVRGGNAIDIGNGFYYMKGRKHKDGGIDLGTNPRTGIEVEDGEVMKVTNKGAKVYSAERFLNGKSPAEKVLNGENANNVFRQQENYKDRKGIKNDGSKRAKGGGIPPYINANNKSNFLSRIKDPNRKTIKDWKTGKVSTHKLSYAEDGNKYVIYPEIQEINGELYDYTNPKYNHGKWDSYDNAVNNGDTIQVNNKEQAEDFTKNYKNYMKTFKYRAGGGIPPKNGVTNSRNYSRNYKSVTPKNKSKLQALKEDYEDIKNTIKNNINNYRNTPQPTKGKLIEDNVIPIYNKVKDNTIKGITKITNTTGPALRSANNYIRGIHNVRENKYKSPVNGNSFMNTYVRIMHDNIGDLSGFRNAGSTIDYIANPKTRKKYTPNVTYERYKAGGNIKRRGGASKFK